MIAWFVVSGELSSLYFLHSFFSDFKIVPSGDKEGFLTLWCLSFLKKTFCSLLFIKFFSKTLFLSQVLLIYLLLLFLSGTSKYIFNFMPRGLNV